MEGGSREYQRGSAEQYIMSNLDRIGFKSRIIQPLPHLGKDAQATTPEVWDALVTYKKDIDRYNQIVENFEPIYELSLAKLGAVNYGRARSAISWNHCIVYCPDTIAVLRHKHIDFR